MKSLNQYLDDDRRWPTSFHISGSHLERGAKRPSQLTLFSSRPVDRACPIPHVPAFGRDFHSLWNAR
jgi:hypothetical protein